MQNICLIADIDCPHSLIYLEALSRRGVIPQHVIVVTFSDKRQRLSFRRLMKGVNLKSSNSQEKRLRLFLRKSRFAYSDLKVKTFYDLKLISKMKTFENCAFIYTCGGIVPKNYFQDFGFRILHCHLGKVPEFRGSDCLFWSILQEDKIGASIFYMEERLDRGRLIAHMTMPLVLPKEYPYISTVSKSFYSYLNEVVDPIIRAEFLSFVLAGFINRDYRYLPNQNQDLIKSRDFLSIHPRLYDVVSSLIARKEWQYFPQSLFVETMQIEFANRYHE